MHSTFADCRPESVLSWERAFSRFVKALTLAKPGRRLVLKSPPHTARIPNLLKLYPDARFIHVVRDPYAVYASTLKLWRMLYAVHGLQKPSWEGLREHILKTFVRLHDSYEDSRDLIPKSHLHELRYEDLVSDPVSRLEVVYRALGLDDFEPARGTILKYLAQVSGYESNPYHLTAEERTAINDRWHAYFRQYSYSMVPN